MTVTEKIHAAQTVRGILPEEYPVPFPSIAAMLAHHEREYAERTFMVFYDDDNVRKEYSYRAFIHNVRRLASVLYSGDVRRGDRIVIAAHNHPEILAQYFAVWMLGACVVPLNMSEDDSRLQYIMDHADMKDILAHPEYRARLEPLYPEHKKSRSRRTAPKIPTGSDVYEATDARTTSHLDDDCLIVYTSGTTGNPKGVVLTQRNILADSAAIAAWHGITPETRMMCVLPVHHVNGTVVTHVTPMLAGASLVLNRKFQTEHFFARIARENVDVVSVVPTLLAFLLEAKVKAKEQITSDAITAILNGFGTVICGAGPLTCELARRFEAEFHIPITHGYGLSETTCYSCFLPIDLTPEQHRHWMQDYGFPSIGVPLPANEMAIHDEHGNALGANERGEIVIRGANVMREYFQNPEANETTFAHGWFRSGDEGFFVLGEDNDGQERQFFFITGRLKELIIRGGVNFAPLEIDEVLAAAPGVKAAICVGFENDFYGEEVGALVVPAQTFRSADDAEASKQAILEYCRSVLPFSKAPKVVVFTNELPVTSTGKYQRNRVKHYFAAWKAVQFRKERA
jgi:acyl-CoA synthetase (AMP-forming)/AMP-acid ligase II